MLTKQFLFESFFKHTFFVIWQLSEIAYSTLNAYSAYIWICLEVNQYLIFKKINNYVEASDHDSIKGSNVTNQQEIDRLAKYSQSLKVVTYRDSKNNSS